jgi:hypothetical protein
LVRMPAKMKSFVFPGTFVLVGVVIFRYYDLGTVSTVPDSHLHAVIVDVQTAKPLLEQLQGVLQELPSVDPVL